MYFIRSLSRIFRFLPCFLQRLMETQKVNISFPENVYFVREIIGQANATLLPIRKEKRSDLRTTNYVFDVWRKITLAATVRRKKIAFTVRDCIILRYAQKETTETKIKTQQQRLETKMQQILFLISLLCFCKPLTSLLEIHHIQNKLK